MSPSSINIGRAVGSLKTDYACRIRLQRSFGLGFESQHLHPSSEGGGRQEWRKLFGPQAVGSR